ncbi:MAG: hypothetical protein K6B70_04330 [Clostridia bacterium]|nr:hypothetical protein [Clostridia bacterium]
MNIFKTGYIVAIINNYQKFSYTLWPLTNIENDVNAEKLVAEGDERWFMVYDMLEIAPDFDYASRYNEYCRSIGMNTTILMVESLYNYFDVQDNKTISTIYGYDCIGTIGYSYLDNDRDIFEKDFEKNGIKINQYGLFDSIESVKIFAQLRNKYISDGNDIENYWDMIPIRLCQV